MKNLENKIQVLNENRGETSLFEYVENESQNDPNFFRWLFNEDFDNDFNSSLTDLQKQKFENWLLELKKEYLLEKWIVVQFPYADETDAIRVTRRENFQQMNFCEAYGDYGVQVDCNNAGCYSLDNSSSSFKSDLESFIKEKFNIEGEFSYDEYKEQQEDRIDTEQLLFIEIDKSVKSWIEDNETHTQITGWTYHDSHNFKTVISETDFGEADCIELDEDEQAEILMQLPSFPHIEGTNASEETEDFIFHFDRWADNPWYCYVTRK